ncbi:B12-binding domain-containing radical SAM protein [Magnetospira thiophila]
MDTPLTPEEKPLLKVEPGALAADPQWAAKARAELDRIFKGGTVQRILFIVPPDGDASMFDLRTGRLGRYPNYPAYGAMSMASHLRDDKVDSKILNLNAGVLAACQALPEGEDFDFPAYVRQAVETAIGDFQPNLIGVSCMFSQTHRSARDTLALVRDLAPSVPLAVGGVHVSNGFAESHTRASLVRDLDMVDLYFLYECDTALRDFVRMVNGAGDVNDLAQVVFNGPEGLLHLAGWKRPVDAELDRLPAHDLDPPTDLARHGRIGTFHGLVPEDTVFGTVLFNRGCRAQCSFCTVRNFNGVGVRSRSVDSMLDELTLLKERYGVGHVMWLDDDFLYDRPKVMALFDGMVQRNLNMTWDCSNGVLAHSCTEDVIAAAEASGCIGLNIGMESGNPQILKSIRKPATVDVLLRAADVLRPHQKINTRIFLMYGFPGETVGMVRDTFEVARQMNLDWCFVAPLQPLPNTPLFTRMATEGLIASSDFDQVRYTLGAYGKHRTAAQKAHGPMALPFEDVFEGLDPDAPPQGEDLTRIWSYMNYHLNFGRLLEETRRQKLEQAFKFIDYIARVIAPRDVFALLFRAYLVKALRGQSDPQALTAIQAVIAEAPFWQERLDELGLDVEGLAG